MPLGAGVVAPGPGVGPWTARVFWAKDDRVSAPLGRTASGPDRFPSQQSPVTCGAACLTVARMLVDPVLHAWIDSGAGPAPAGCSGGDLESRFGSYERVVHARTNAVHPRTASWQPPWPRALGTPPWGAIRELEHGAALPGIAYGVRLLRWHEARAEAELLGARVRPGAPTLLFLGDTTLPRHIVLVHEAEHGAGPHVYDPAYGRVTRYAADTVTRRLRNPSGWDRVWLTVHPVAAPRRNPPLRELTARLRRWLPRPDMSPGTCTRDAPGER